MTTNKITIEFGGSTPERVDAFLDALTKLTDLTFVNGTVTYGEPTPDDSLRSLREQGYVVKAWTRDDLENYVNDEEGAAEAIGERLEHVIDQAAEDRAFRDLADCTDDDWEKVRIALNEGLAAEGITTYTF